MAVLSKVPGLEVRILVRGEPLHEYQERGVNVPRDSVERYIEAQTNAYFEIHYSFTQPFPQDRAVSMLVTIDGKDVDEPLLRPFELFERKGHISSGPVYKSGSSWKVRKYRFQGIRIEENDGIAVSEELRAALKPVGIISCGFYFLENQKRSNGIHKPRRGMEVLPPIDEKALKGDALSHHATLGATEVIDDIEYFDADYADDGHPFATFHFYYRSKEALRDLHIIERTPEPMELLDDDGGALGQMNREQLQAMCRRMMDREQTRLRLKREMDSPDTVAGDEVDEQQETPDLQVVRSVDRRAAKRARTRRQVADGSEVIEIDD